MRELYTAQILNLTEVENISCALGEKFKDSNAFDDKLQLAAAVQRQPFDGSGEGTQ